MTSGVVIRGLTLWHAEMILGGETFAQPTRDISPHKATVYTSKLLRYLDDFEVQFVSSNHQALHSRHSTPSSILGKSLKHQTERSSTYKEHHSDTTLDQPAPSIPQTTTSATMPFRFTPLLRQRLFTTSTRSRNAFAIGDVAAEELAMASKAVPKLGRIARWYLPTMAVAAVGMMYIPTSLYLPRAEPKPRSVTLDAANRHIGYSITTALNEANRAVHVPAELTQEQKNQALMDLYGERSSLEDMERAIAGMETRATSQKDRNAALEAAYGDRSSIKDLERAMQMYEVQ